MNELTSGSIVEFSERRIQDERSDQSEIRQSAGNVCSQLADQSATQCCNGRSLLQIELLAPNARDVGTNE